MKAFGVSSCIVLLVFAGTLSAGESSYKKEMDELKARVLQLEQKREAPPSPVSFHGVMVGNVQALSSQETQDGAVE